jgi:hypothetical protein
MPLFSVGILAGQLLLLNLFGVPEILGIVAGIPAFLIAASPDHLDLRRHWLTLGFSLLGVAAIVLVGAMRAGMLGSLVLGSLIAAGALIGFWTRALEEFRRFWLPIGILLALLVGSIVFAFGHYGQNNCWP